MGAYNGGKYIAEQLDSLPAQTHKNWRLIVSDDGSTDNTLYFVNKRRNAWGSEKVEIRQGPQKGFVQNFLSMACDPTVRADYYAFCDQDDVWLPKKLQVAVEYLESSEKKDVPHVYCGRTAYVGDNLKPYRYSSQFVFPRTFRNALIQSIAGGNTMVFNQAAKELLENAGQVPTPSHDWWLYQLVTGAGGIVHYDPVPYILYRQHENALVGGNTSIISRLERVTMVFKGQFKTWCDQNIECLESVRPLLNDSSCEILDLFSRMRTTTFKNRLRLLEVCGLYRQTWRGTLSLIVAAIFKKI